MSYSLEQQRTGFEAFLQGNDEEALFSVIESERRPLYDYLLRNGVPAHAATMVLEKLPVLIIPEAEHLRSFDQFRVKIFQKAREIGFAHRAGGELTIENPGYLQSEDYPPDADPMETVLLKSLEKLACDLPAEQREIVSLHFIHQFSIEAIAELMNASQTEVEQGVMNFKSDQQEIAGILPDELRDSFAKVPLIPLQFGSGISTVALSQVVGELRRARPRKGFWRRSLPVLVILIATGVVTYLYLS